jgi:AmmeMemoRadiSam system protein B
VEGPAPKALIVPHAGYVYSGPVAATAYARLRPYRRQADSTHAWSCWGPVTAWT